MAQENVQNSVRDATFLTLRSNPQNNFCIDCEKKNPRWTSVYLGVHLCIDCAGKHRQYGVMYSFVKSTNLDSWNSKQIRFMELGGNTRALEYFKKFGIINSTNKHIDYKSSIVQKYKGILKEEVENSIQGKIQQKNIQVNLNETPQQATRPQKQIQQISTESQSNISNNVEQVQETVIFKKNKKDKKKINAKRINVDFQNFEFDDGISQLQKEKLMKVSENPLVIKSNILENHQKNPYQTVAKIEAPKQMQLSTAKQTLQNLKLKNNVKAISSDNFKQTNINSAVLQQNLNKFSGAQSISSKAFFGEEQEGNQDGINVIDMLSSAGEKLFSFLNK